MGLIDTILAPFRTSQGAVRSDSPPANLPDAELTRSQRYDGESRLIRMIDDDPAFIGRIFSGASRRIDQQIELADEIEQSDDHINGTLELRRTAVSRLQMTITPGDDSKKAMQAADEARKLTEAPWFRGASDALLRSVFLQWAAVEVTWRTEAKRWTPISTREVEPGRWYLALDGRPHFYRDLLRKFEADTVPAIAGKYMLMGSSLSSTPGARAKVRAIAKLWYLSRCDMTAWGTMIDQWGIPVVKLSYPEGMAEGELQTMVEKIWELAGRRIIAHKAGTTVETEEVPEQMPHESFQVFYRRCASRLLLGQDSAQMAIEGQRTGATLQGSVRDDIRDRDAAALDDAQNETFLAPWCSWNFGPEVAPPRIQRTVREARDPQARASVFKTAREMGLRLLSTQVYEDLNLEVPEGTPEILEPAMGLPLSGAEFGVEPQSTQRTQSGEIAAGAGAAGVPAAGSVANTGLNGAQVTSLTELLQTVTTKQQSPEVAKALISAAFPMIAADLVATMVNAAANFTPAAPVDQSPAETPAEPKSGQDANSASDAQTVAARARPELPENAIESAAREYGELLAPLREQIKAVASEIDAMEIGDAEKVTMLRARLPELLDSEYGTGRRAELVRLATMASYARGAVRVHEDAQARRKGKTQ